MLGKVGILIDQKFGKKFLKLSRLLEAMELERDPNGKFTSVTESLTPLKTAVAAIIPYQKNNFDLQGKTKSLNQEDLTKLRNSATKISSTLEKPYQKRQSSSLLISTLQSCC